MCNPVCCSTKASQGRNGEAGRGGGGGTAGGTIKNRKKGLEGTGNVIQSIHHYIIYSSNPSTERSALRLLLQHPLQEQSKGINLLTGGGRWGGRCLLKLWVQFHVNGMS